MCAEAPSRRAPLPPEPLFLGQEGPGQPETHCVWKGTSPKTRKLSFRAWAQAQGEPQVRAKGQGFPWAAPGRSCGHRPLLPALRSQSPGLGQAPGGQGA